MLNGQLLLIKLLVGIFSLLPFSLLYILSDLLAWLFYHVIRYRRSVILSNFSRSFPEKSRIEIDRFVKQFYIHFCDILLESIKGLSMKREELERRFIYKNPEIFDAYFEKKESVILLGSHYGNWEWGVLSFPLAVKHNVIGVFKPLKNKPVDNYLQTKRKRWGLELTNMRFVGRSVIQQKNTPSIFVFIADQTPSDVHNAYWLEFLHQETPFLNGAEKIAKKTGYPVFQYEIQRKKRGYYEVTFSPICLNPKETNGSEITQSFAESLEKLILENPPNWLWSHRRWKRKKPQQKSPTVSPTA